MTACIACGFGLDRPMIDRINGKGTVVRYYRHLYNRFKKYGIDFAEEPILIYPAEHYQNGGVITDDNGKSDIPNLYVIGEAAGGVHGRNRLGGNSLSDLFVFGRRAGIQAGKEFRGIRIHRLTLDHLIEYEKALGAEGIDRNRKSPMVLPEYRFEKALPVFQQ